MKRLSIALFILRDMFRMSRLAVLAIGPFGLLADIARLLGAGLLLQFIGGYARSADGPRLDVLGIDLGIGASASRAWMWVGVIALTAAVATALEYATVYAQLHIGRQFADHASDQALVALRDHPQRPSQSNDPSGFIRGSGAMLGSIAPAIRMLVFGTLMFFMRPGLSLVMLVVGIIFLGPLTIALGDRVRRATLRKQKTKRRGGNSSNVAVLSSGPLYGKSIRMQAYNKSRTDLATKQRYEAIFQVRANQELARAAAAAFTGVGAIILAVGLTIGETPGASEVGSLLAYAIVAQFAFRSVAQIGVNAVLFNRYLHTYESYVEMRRANQVHRLQRPKVAVRPELPGQVWMVQQRHTPDAWILRDWVEAIGLDPETATAVALAPEDLPDRPVYELMLGGHAATAEDLDRCLDFVNDAVGHQLTDDELDGSLRQLDDDDALLSAIALCPVVLQSKPLLVVLPAKLLARFGRRRREDVLRHLKIHHVVVVGRGRKNMLDLADKVIDGDSLDLPGQVDEDDEEDDAA
ncbi:MAG: ABC transporter ATP-binding protein [Acidimicrobiales bacterium]|nr:ABC transporter ATP-binding protein [Acidimicrobiales bacterium]